MHEPTQLESQSNNHESNKLENSNSFLGEGNTNTPENTDQQPTTQAATATSTNGNSSPSTGGSDEEDLADNIAQNPQQEETTIAAAEEKENPLRKETAASDKTTTTISEPSNEQPTNNSTGTPSDAASVVVTDAAASSSGEKTEENCSKPLEIKKEEEEKKMVEEEQLDSSEAGAAAKAITEEASSSEKPSGTVKPKKETTTSNTDEKNKVSRKETTTSNPDEKIKVVAAVKAGDSTQKAQNDPKNATTMSSSTTPVAIAPAAAPVVATAALPPPPVMKGTLSYDLEQRRHLIRGMWNYENSNELPAQRFELLRNLSPTETVEQLPADGEFHGSFSLAYVHTTSKGKRKERSKVVPESGVKIKFTPVEGKPGEYTVHGMGTNQFGVFHINGTASPSSLPDDPQLHIVLSKRYEATPAATISSSGGADAATTNSDSGGRVTDTSNSVSNAAIVLPPPSKSYPSGTVCLRGKLFKEESNDLGLTEVIHRINGMWASGLDFLLADPKNTRGLANRFEYEHKSSIPSQTLFPVSGRYSGWFDLTNDDGTRTRINERDVTLKFRKNNAGYHNVEGKGSNLFGKYSITGTLTADNILTIFRHFQARKIKNKSVSIGTAGASSAVGALAGGPLASTAGASLGTAASQLPLVRRPSTGGVPPYEPKLKLDDVKLPPEASVSAAENGLANEKLEPLKPPEHNTYSAVSRGVLRLNEDGSHSCQGKWAVTREHFTNGQTSNFTFRLEAHFAAEAVAKQNGGAADGAARQFPVDSDMYKGSFQLKKQGSRYQTIVDQEVVMKFRMNAQGAYNVYGKGINAIGEFNLVGTMVMSGKTGGQVELYRMYPPEKLSAPKAPPATIKPDLAASTAAFVGAAASNRPSVPSFPGPPQSLLQRRESTRLVKLPSKLEDDDPTAMLSRTMGKCSSILRLIRDKDVELGAFFSAPVDPVALGIPTYHQIIKEPMDLRTISRRMESASIDSPEEFARLVKLVFENAITFNIDPAHSVHQAARTLLVLFNQKFRDVERMMQNLKRAQGDNDEKGKKKGKEENKKRKRELDEPPKSLKRRRLEEAQAMAASNANAVAAIVAAAPATSSPTVTRTEFNMLLNMIQQLQRQIVQTHTGLAELSPGDENDANTSASVVGVPVMSSSVSEFPAPSASALAPERKKSVKRKSEPAPAPAPEPFIDDSMPLTLDEQELLTETINELPSQHLGSVIEIIREAAPVGADEDEIDLEIDQLDTKTQRKLLRHVQKFVKKPKPPKKKPKQTQQAKKSDQSVAAKKAKARAASPVPVPAPAPAPKPKAASDSFFAFGNKGDSDSDSDSDEEDQKTSTLTSGPFGGKTLVPESSSKEFQLGAGLGDLHDDNDDDLGNGGFAANWNMSKPVDKSEKKGGDDDDDAWGAAREHAAVAKAREAERKAREEKMKAEAEAAKEQRLVDAAARGEELKAQRLEEEANEAKLREQQEKEAEEARKAAREAMTAQVQSVEQTVDLDAQRDIMKQYEQSFLDKDLGSASPSSDFGF